MDLPTEPSPPRRSSRTTGSSNSSSSSSPATYGYHNTFHTHAQLPIGNPPTYACATNPQTLRYLNDKAHAELAARHTERLPPAYSCSVEIGGIMGVRQELSTPFEVASSREWNDVYVLLRGTKLSIHRLKNPSLFSKDRSPVAGRLIKSYTLQHAEVGVASDFKKTPLIPKSPFAHMVPKSAREKLYETDPHLFEPVREHAIRLRLEAEQFLLCANSQESMLSWVEQLCSAIDISPPLEDRSEPRYRSLPRRSRRQRVLDGSRLGENLENLSEMEAGRRIIAEQERIIRQLYPHLAGPILPDADEPTTASRAVDHEQDDFDPEDVRFPTRRPDSSSLSRSESHNGNEIDHERPSSSASDPKLAPRIQPSASQVLRYRRRCAPVLLASSPRVSDVVFYDGKRMRLDVKEHDLVEYTSHPPRYDAHHFPKSKSKRSKSERNRQSPRATTKPTPPPLQTDQPTSPHRLASDDSITFGYDLASTSSEHAIDEIQSAGSSGPPSPTTLTRAKEDATHQLVSLDKRRNSDESRENRLGTVTMGVGLLI